MKKALLNIISTLFILNNGSSFNSVALAGENNYFYLSTYSAPFFYYNSQSRKNGFSLGAYSYFGNPYHFFEGNINYSNFVLTSGKINSYDAVLSYTNYQLPNLGLKVGSNVTATSYSGTDQGAVLFTGLKYFAPYNINAGLDFYTSFYRGYNNQQPIFQLTPGAGISLGDINSFGTFNLETKGYYIKLPQDAIIENKNMLSLEGSLTYNYNNTFSIKSFGWFGEQAFAVRDSGFTVFNVPEKHFAGYGLAFKYSISKQLKASVSWYNEYYYGIGSSNQSVLVTFPITINYDF